MRNNSGKDEARTTLRDPTLRESELGRAGPGTTGRGTGSANRTTGLGSNDRKGR